MTFYDARISYFVQGKEDGIPVVLLHAIGTNHSLWDQQAEVWGRTHKIIRCDLPGYGESPPAKPPFTMFSYADAVVGMLDQLNIAAAHIVGLSLGGMIGSALALAHPERVQSLVIADARVDAPDEYRAIWDTLIGMAEKEGMAAVAAFMLNRWFGDRAAQPDAGILAVAKSLDVTSADGFIASARAIQQLDYLNRVAEISCPTLLLVGANDGVLPDVMADIHRRIPGSMYQVIEGAGHLANIDQPETFTNAVTRFLDAHG